MRPLWNEIGVVVKREKIPEDLAERKKQIRDELVYDITHPEEKWYVPSSTQKPYVLGNHPECPYAYPLTGNVPEHRYVWWLHHKDDPLLKIGDIIHHINGNNQDNRIENLKLVTAKEHRKIHGKTISKALNRLKRKKNRKNSSNIL
jgi:hypothetical protein